MLRSRLLSPLLLGAGWVLLAVGGAACSHHDPADGTWVGDDVTRNDFEAVAGWGGADRATLTREHAHSGRYAVRVDSTHEVGLTFDLPLFEASVHTLQAVEVEAWVYLPNDKADATLQVEAVAEGAGAAPPLYSEQLPLLSQVTEFGRWTSVQHIFHLPGGLPGNTHLRLFLKRGSNPGPVYLDDIRVKAREW